MHNYQKILVAVDLHEVDALKLIKKARLLLKPKGEIYLIHVTSILDNLYPVSAMGGAVPLEVDSYQRKYVAEAKAFLETLAVNAGLGKENACLMTGSQTQQIKKTAQEKQVDLIVLGVHEKHRLISLPGSVANGVLHSAPCDVLSVAI